MSNKSESLEDIELTDLFLFIQTFKNQSLCAKRLRISRLTLHNIQTKGSGKPETIRKIRKAIYAK